MIRRRNVISVTILLALVSLLLAACGSPEATATPQPTATPVAGATPTPGEPAATPAPSFDAEAYFRGKTVRIIVGFNPGGGTDTHSRFFAANLGRYIPGNPRVIVSNVTPNVAAQNLVWRSQPDGLTWSYNPSPLIDTAEDPAAEFVASGFGYIGAALRYDAVWLINGNMPYATIREAIGASGPPLIMADSAGSPQELTQNTLPAMLMADWFDIPFEFRNVATTGTAQALLMLERGDMNNIVRSSNLWFQMPLLRSGWVSDGTLRPFASFLLDGGVPPANTEGAFDAPNFLEFLSEEQKATWDGVVAPTHFISRTITTSPNVPDDVLNALRDAWQAALADDAFRSEFERLIDQEVTVFDHGSVIQEEVRRIEASYKANLDNITELSQRIFDKYVR